MMNGKIASIFLLFCVLFSFAASAMAQGSPAPVVRSQEISEGDGLPVLIKHLPNWQDVRSSTVFVSNLSDIKKAAGNRPVLDQFDFPPGTEAVKADYPAGKLLIVEFMNPQASVDADNKIHQHLALSGEQGTIYRRIGNYSVFVFDVADQQQAFALIDQVKYEKSVQWLGEDPFLIQRFERYFIATTRNIFISTVLWIVGGMGVAIVCGLIAGVIFFRFREHKKNTWHAYTDAGGMTRLNLDDLSE